MCHERRQSVCARRNKTITSLRVICLFLLAQQALSLWARKGATQSACIQLPGGLFFVFAGAAGAFALGQERRNPVRARRIKNITIIFLVFLAQHALSLCATRGANQSAPGETTNNIPEGYFFVFAGAAGAVVLRPQKQKTTCARRNKQITSQRFFFCFWPICKMY